MHPSWRRFFAGWWSLALLVSAGFAAETPLAKPDLIRALKEGISGERAYRFTEAISRFDRVQASSGFHDAAAWIKGELEGLGYKDVALEGWPSDGSRCYYTYRSVIGWKVKKADLWMIAPERDHLCSFAEVPLTVVKHSGSGNIEAPLVDVGSGVGEAAYAGKDVRGKIVLATGSTAEVMKEAVLSRRAAGVLTYFAPDVRPGYPNMIRYTALWPRWEDRDKLGFAFNISKNQGAALKRMLEDGRKVVLKADIETEFDRTRIEVLSAAFPGTTEPDKEIMIVGHLCHPAPSANDNASGSGGMLEMARALKALVDGGVIPPPRRTIRFVWVPEYSGFVPYIQAHLERTRNTLAAVNCDMIGEDLHKTGGMFGIYGTPGSNPSFLNDVAADFAALVDSLELTSLNGSGHPFAWKLYPYSGGSDHEILNDGALKVPAVMLNRGDTFHHTSLDTMDKVDPTELRRSCAVALGISYYLAAASDPEALRMARRVARNGLGRIAADYYDGLEGLYAAADSTALVSAYRGVLNAVSQATVRETRALVSTLAFASTEETAAVIKSLNLHFDAAGMTFPKEANRIYKKRCADLGFAPGALPLTKEERRLSRIVPVRAEDFVCPLETEYLVEKLGEAAVRDLELRGDRAYEALNFADGKRSVQDIVLALSAEFGPVEARTVLSYFEILEKAGLMTLKKS